MNPHKDNLPHCSSVIALLVFLAVSCSPGTFPVPTATQMTAIDPIQTAMPTPTATGSQPIDEHSIESQMTILLSLLEGANTHLFYFSPSTSIFTRLTNNPWDDITPALSPDGTQIAYASRRNGYWDLYLFNLTTGEIQRLTDTPEYDAFPSWSPDGQWLVFETYIQDNLELALLSVSEPSLPAIRLTETSAFDRMPTWSPDHRHVAFVSNADGEDDIWIADLQDADNRFNNVSHDMQHRESTPSWSPDGTKLAWSAISYDTGMAGIFLWDSLAPDVPARWIASGDWALFVGNDQILTRISAPNETYLAIYTTSGSLALPPVPIPGNLQGLSAGTLPPLSALAEALQQAAMTTATPLYQPRFETQSDVPADRIIMVDLADVQAPYPRMHDGVDEAFQALRAQIASITGWDALANLENAYVPISTPLDPGMGNDWYYTGRAFALNSVLVNAGWIAVIREDFGQQTYWRIFLRTRAQDGSQGMPLRQIPWDFSTRYSGNPVPYEQGGSLAASIPPGYWVDFTSHAAAYGWERLQALTNWRTYYKGTRYGEFYLAGGLDWYSAMLEVYPPELLITPTVVIPPSRTPTRTPWGYKTPTPSLTPTPRPTLTQQP